MQKTHHQIKKKLIKSFLCKNIENSSHLSLFASSLTEIVATAILKTPKKEQQKILEALTHNHFDKIIRYFKKKDEIIANALLLLLHSEKKLKHFKTRAQTKESKMALCLLDESQFEYENMEKHLKNLPLFSCFSTYNALKKLLYARLFFLRTDLKKASKNVIKSARFFQKKQMDNELAYAYFMLGEIYQRADFYDAGEMMFRTAEQIYQKTGHIYGQHQLYTAFAESFLKQKRFDEAELYLERAIKKCRAKNSELYLAEALNQKAMLLNIKKDHTNARRTAQSALKKHKALKNTSGAALSLAQIAIAAYYDKDFLKAKQYILTAQKKYQSAKDDLSSIDLLALLVHTCLELNENEAAKKYFNILKRKQKKYPNIISKDMMNKLQQKFPHQDKQNK